MKLHEQLNTRSRECKWTIEFQDCVPLSGVAWVFLSGVLFNVDQSVIRTSRFILLYKEHPCDYRILTYYNMLKAMDQLGDFVPLMYVPISPGSPLMLDLSLYR